MARGSGGARWALVLAAVAILVVGVTWGIRLVGYWLVVEDPLEPAQAIVVLSGSMPLRALEAADIYRRGYSAEVWVTRSASPVEELRQMGIGYVGEEFYNEKVLMHRGVPADAIRILQEPVENTEEEVREIAAELQRVGGSKVIVVTSKPHTRRVKAIWKVRVGGSPRLIVRFASQDSFDAAHWWRHTRDALDVVREVLGLVNVWAGLPVRPRRD
jgi:uncharacterized SAM-binding protein YcdF (DUF218 family)